ncbi:glycoside hydrolase family 3 N-terminal domain-containing protein [Malaciobacter marinus]|uniref:glycoside hydrolase family 3 N-terminal domain-containing protein n=1 Tax=Malaciobacter marinus TaxID=505249 RepID=UPI003B00F39C
MRNIFLFFFFFFNLNVFANSLDENLVKKQIAKMLIVGFDKAKIDNSSQIVKDIKKYQLGGVILFDKNLQDKSKSKNIISFEQVKKLTQSLQNLVDYELIISIDQEGGKVQRLKKEYGFIETLSANDISKLSLNKVRQEYKSLALQLSELGINLNFAPVVDLAINPNNKVITKLNRAYSTNVNEVVKYAKILIQEQEKNKVTSVLKHFPGHGSSLEDSHNGFVDITNSWNKIELEPYKKLIKQNSVDMIMTAHVFNKNLDENYPATLSYKVNTKLLRKKLGFQGIIISDDLQMKAISKHYSLNEVVRLTINSGVNILLFGNQLAKYKTTDIINTIYEEVEKGNIAYEKIIQSNKKIKNYLFRK